MKRIELSEDEWKVIEERAKELPKGFYIGILGKSLSKEELISSIKERNDIGKAYAKMQYQVMRWYLQQAVKNG